MSEISEGLSRMMDTLSRVAPTHPLHAEYQRFTNTGRHQTAESYRVLTARAEEAVKEAVAGQKAPLPLASPSRQEAVEARRRKPRVRRERKH